jgi:putative transposase
MTFIRTHDRKSIRLKEYDYSQPGEYFITICKHDKQCIFGEIVDEEIQLSKEGEIVKEEWLRTSIIRPDVKLDSFIIMPNHIHGIIVLNEMHESYGRGTSQRAPTVERFGKPTSNSIPTIIRLFKSVTTKRINQIHHLPGLSIWQRGYYDHIIRGEKDLNNIQDYIINNPIKWSLDDENSDKVKYFTE